MEASLIQIVGVFAVMALVVVNIARPKLAFSEQHRDFQLLPHLLITSDDISDDRGRVPLSSHLYMIKLADYFPKFFPSSNCLMHNFDFRPNVTLIVLLRK